MPKDALHALQKRRGLPSRSFPQPMVGPPQVRQETGAVVVGKEVIGSAL